MIVVSDLKKLEEKLSLQGEKEVIKNNRRAEKYILL